MLCINKMYDMEKNSLLFDVFFINFERETFSLSLWGLLLLFKNTSTGLSLLLSTMFDRIQDEHVFYEIYAVVNDEKKRSLKIIMKQKFKVRSEICNSINIQYQVMNFWYPMPMILD